MTSPSQEPNPRPPNVWQLKELTSAEVADLITKGVKLLESRLATGDPSVRPALERALRRLGPLRPPRGG